MDKNLNLDKWLNKEFPKSEAFQVNAEQAEYIIEFREPIGNFYRESDGVFVGIDNSTGDSFVEEFKDKETCIAWLTNKNITYFTELDYGKSLNELNKIDCCGSEFEVIITEELVTSVVVKANSKAEALSKVKAMYDEERIVLDSEDFNDVSFKID